MARMVRKQVYITENQEAALKEVSARSGVKEAEIIREGIELALSDDAVRTRRKAAFERAEALADRVLALGSVAGEGRAADSARVARTDRGWTRDELHER